MWVKVKNLIGAIFSLSSLKLQLWAFMVAKMIKDLPAVWETWVQSLGWKDLLEEGMATYSSTLPWRIPWAEESDGLQSIRSQRVRQG